MARHVRADHHELNKRPGKPAKVAASGNEDGCPYREWLKALSRESFKAHIDAQIARNQVILAEVNRRELAS